MPTKKKAAKASKRTPVEAWVVIDRYDTVFQTADDRRSDAIRKRAFLNREYPEDGPHRVALMREVV